MKKGRGSHLLALRASLIAALAIAIGGPGVAMASVEADHTSSGSSSLSAVPAGMRILVRFRPDASEAARADAVRSVNGWVETAIPALGVTRIALPGDANDAFGDGAAVAAVLAQHPAVAHAELDATVRLSFDPNDQYYVTDPYSGLGQWGIRKALIDKGWDITRGSASVVVAVLDTGVDPGHPDLAGALVTGAAFVSQPAAECDPNAQRDDNSHGTHVAGVVGANGNNATGVAGVAFGAKIMALKVLDCTGVGSLSDVASGLVWAADHGAKIVNLSLGSPFDSSTMRSAVTYATGKNVLVVGAVGNCGTIGDRCTSLNQVEYPAAYPDVLAVGATDTDDSVAFFSSRNSTVKVSAPGRRIVSTTPTYATYLSRRNGTGTPGYGSFSGTSQASPFVAGLAALIWSAEPALSATAVADRIRTTADDLGVPGRDDGYGSGRINALRALSTTADRFGVTYDTAAVPKSVAAGKPFTARVTLTNTSSFGWRAADPGQTRLTWSWLDGAGKAVAGVTGTMPLASDVAAGATAVVSGPVAPPSSPGSYTLRFDLERTGSGAFSARGAAPATVPVTVGSGFGAAYAPAAATASFDAGGTTIVAVTLTNTGTETWTAQGASPVRLSYHWLQNAQMVVWDGSRGVLGGDVASGQTVTVSMAITPPAKPGSYTLRLDLVREGVAWFSGLGVATVDLPATVRTAFAATYGTPSPAALLPGGRTTIPLTLTNIGTTAWPAQGSNPVHLAAHVTNASGEMVVWDGARTAFASDVAPGAQVKADLVVDAPLGPGTYRVRADLVREGVAWFSGLGVATGDADLLVAADYRAQLPGGPLTVSRANPVVQVQIKNMGVARWSPSGAAPVNVAVHWLDGSGETLVWDGPRTALAGPVAPGETVTLAVRTGPPPSGAAFIVIDLVSEGVAWFGQGPLRAVTFAP